MAVARRTAIAIVVSLIIGAVAGVAGALAAVPRVEVPVEVPSLRGAIPVGGLWPLTGGLAPYGAECKAAFELAIKDVNEFLKEIEAPFWLEGVIEDSATDPVVALEKIESLAARGVKVIVGPMASSEVKEIKAYADANKILVISPSSTDPELAVVGDFIFRFAPDDTKQGPAIARLAFDTGVRHIIRVWRGDPWGDSLAKTTADAFTKLGGSYDPAEDIRYDPKALEFPAEAALLADRVSARVEELGAEKVGVFVAGFKEVAALFADAAKYPILKQVRWYGSDGTAKLPDISEEEVPREFAEATKFISPTFAPTASSKFVSIRERMAELGFPDPIPYAFSSYDIVWVVTFALMSAGKYDAEAIRTALPTAAYNHFGAVGWISLNPAGDLEVADYELWAVIEGKWVHVGTYSGPKDEITWVITL